MKKVSLVLVAAIFLAGCAHGPAALLEEASSATSQVVCSGVFVTGLTPQEAYRAELRPEPGMSIVNWALHYDVDKAHQEVRTRIAGGFGARSVFRDGRGCTLVHHVPPPEALRLTDLTTARASDIAGRETVIATNAGLRAALDHAFAEPTGRPSRATEAVVIVHHGRIVAERYAPGIGIDTAFDGHSLAKSVVNALIGVLVREKRLDVHDRAAAPEWGPSDPRAKITIDNLMRMNAGFEFDEGKGAGTATHMWYTQDDIAHFAAEQSLESPVGQQWHYSSGSYAILSRVIKNLIGGPQALSDFAHREIFDPLGMRNVTIEFDTAGTMMGAHAVYASARDWARFGLLYLRDGYAEGSRLFPEGWVKYSTTPTLESGYGAGFWLNTTNSPVPIWRFPWGLPGAPSDAFFARGYMGQWIVVVPSEDLVMVRMGFSHENAGEMGSVAQLVQEVVRALRDTEQTTTNGAST